ncbi:MAG: histidine phosphatase family protein [Lachnospiraceae bacterium]|nr:histidine phosphatase family protein [Lachnospiraceae bacterium]
MRIFVIRHGESEADILNVHEGRADFNLTKKGHEQAQAMAEYMKTRAPLDKIYASPLKRAFQTATHLSAETNVPITLEDDLMEFNNGLLAGLSYEEADEKYPRVENLPIHESVYEQESNLAFRYRGERILSKIISENEKDATIVIVSHGGMINQLYHAFLKLPVQSGMIFATGDTGIHEWLIRGDERIILGSNHTAHLV